MYSEKSSDILNRMLSNAETSSQEGTFIYDALCPVSEELSKIENDLDINLEKAFAKTAYQNKFSKELELRCFEHGVYRKQGQKATGIVTFTGVAGTRIPKNTLVQTQLNLQYVTTQENFIADNKTIDIPIQAISDGVVFNVKANTINQLPIKLVGVGSVNNKYNIENGRDRETDESLYNRLCIKVQKPSTSGNIYDYKIWGTSVDGVGNCIVKPLWNGNGTVKVILVDSKGRCPSQEIIKKAKTYIDTQRPIGADITVTGVQEINIKIDTKLILEKDTDLDKVKANIIENINKYLEKIATKDNKVRYNRIANCILDVENVIDYTELKINNNSTDIILNEDSIAVLESVVVCNAN